jgi:cell division protein FtsB
VPQLLSLLVAVIILVAGAITCVPLIREKAVQKRVQLELEEQLRIQEAITRDLTARIVAVKTDPATVERLAREKFGLARPGETVFKFRNDFPRNQSRPARSAAPRNWQP